MKEQIAKIYYDLNDNVSSVTFNDEIARCKDCNSAVMTDTPFVKYCTIWNKIVPLQGYCYLGNVKYKKGVTNEEKETKCSE